MSHPILYRKNATEFFNLGLGVLKDAIHCIVVEERNGVFELEMTYPNEGAQAALVEVDCIIKADAGHRLEGQLFRIERIDKSMKGIMKIYAKHISYLAQSLALAPNVRMTDMTANDALTLWRNSIVGSHPFVTSSNITDRRSTHLTIHNCGNARLALGGTSNSILDVWGGEYLFDNYRIDLLAERGGRANTLISYGRNLTDLDQEENITNTYTSIYPYAIFRNDDKEEIVTLSAPNYVLDSEHAKAFAHRRVLPVDFSGEFENDVRPTVAALRQLAENYISENEIGVPRVSISLSFVDLTKSLNQAGLTYEQLNLCDTVPVYFEKLGIHTHAKIVRIEWNVLLDQYEKLEVGATKMTLGDTIREIERDVNNANNNSNTALTSANGSNTNFYGPNEPKANRVGDLWYRPNGEHTELWTWNGAAWEFVMSTAPDEEFQRILEENRRKIEEAMNSVFDIETGLDTLEKDLEDNRVATQQAKEMARVAQEAGADAKQAGEKAAQAVDVASKLASEAIENANHAVSQATDARNHAQTAFDLAEPLVQQVDTLKGDVTSVVTTAAGLQTTVSGVNGLESRVTQLNNQFNVTVGELNNLSIGTSNMIRNATWLNGMMSWQASSGTKAVVEETHLGYPVVTWSATGRDNATSRVFLNQSRNQNILEANTDYTLSGWVRVNGNAKFTGTNDIFVRINNEAATSSLDFISFRFENLVPNEWTYFEVTRNTGPRIRLTQIQAAFQTNGDISISQLMLVKGNRAPRDWSPSIEDMATQSQMTVLNDAINMRVEKNGVVSQLNLSPENILIQGKRIHLSGESSIDNAVIGEAQIKNAAITTAKIDNLAVDNAKIANLNAAKINAGTINADRIGADSITAEKLKAASITGDKIAANAIATSHIRVADFTNLAQANEYDASSLIGGAIHHQHSQRWIRNGHASTSGVHQIDFLRPIIPTFNVSDEYHVRFTAFRESGTLTAIRFIIRYQYTDGWVNAVVGSNITLTTSPANYTANVRIATAIDSSRQLQHIRFFFEASASSTGFYHLRDVGIFRRNNAQMIVDGAITANKIGAGAITADHIGAEEITADKIVVKGDKGISAAVAKVIELDAGNITTGTLKAIDITGCTITGTTILGSTIRTDTTSDEVNLESGSASTVSSRVEMSGGRIAVQQDMSGWQDAIRLQNGAVSTLDRNRTNFVMARFGRLHVQGTGSSSTIGTHIGVSHGTNPSRNGSLYEFRITSQNPTTNLFSTKLAVYGGGSSSKTDIWGLALRNNMELNGNNINTSGTRIGNSDSGFLVNDDGTISLRHRGYTQNLNGSNIVSAGGNVTIGGIMERWGSRTFDRNNGGTQVQTVSFSADFTDRPNITTQIVADTGAGGTSPTVTVTSVSATGFSVRLHRDGFTGDVTLHWRAIGRRK